MKRLVFTLAVILVSATALLGVVLFCVALQQLFILPEEQRLTGWFGDDYRAYCRQVRRWL